MNKVYRTATIVLSCVLLNACNASFTPVTPDSGSTEKPDTTKAPWFILSGMKLPLTGFAMLDKANKDPWPQNLRLIIAWEIPDFHTDAYYIYGEGIVATNWKNFKDDVGRDVHGYDIVLNISDTIPRFLARWSEDTLSAIAVGHIFATTNPNLVTGRTIVARNDMAWDSLGIVGGVDGEAIVYAKGKVELFGRNLSSIFASSGFKLLHTDFQKPPLVWEDTRTDRVIVDIDHDPEDTRMQNPMWLR